MPSLGEELRRQREQRQVSLREISDSTKISIRFLEALEQNEFKHLPGGQFNKGFIRAFCRHIGVDPEKMVALYLEELQRQAAVAAAAPGALIAAAPPRRSHAVTIVATLIVLALVLGGAGLLAWILTARAHVNGPDAGVGPISSSPRSGGERIAAARSAPRPPAGIPPAAGRMA